MRAPQGFKVAPLLMHYGPKPSPGPEKRVTYLIRENGELTTPSGWSVSHAPPGCLVMDLDEEGGSGGSAASGAATAPMPTRTPPPPPPPMADRVEAEGVPVLLALQDLAGTTARGDVEQWAQGASSAEAHISHTTQAYIFGGEDDGGKPGLLNAGTPVQLYERLYEGRWVVRGGVRSEHLTIPRAT